MKDPYQTMTNHIHTPDGLSDRVLSASRRRQPGARAEVRRSRPALRAAVCGACALALVVGTLTLRPAEDGAVTPGGTPVLVPQYTFGLTAHAAGTGETWAAGANGGLALLAGDGLMDPAAGVFTGCLFQVEGEAIQTVSLAIDRGGLYRCRLHTDLTPEEMAACREAMADGSLLPAAISQSGDGVWSMPEMSVLGTSATVPYEPDVQYGFWVPPADMTMDPSMDPWAERAANVDVFDGATLSVTVTFTDGTEQRRDYRLSTGKLRTVHEADGTLTVLPQLAGEDESYLYGVYAASEEESRWLSWPVEGAGTVSLSNPYGQPGEGAAVHAGIDIPAAAGAPVLAAAAGTVAEVGFDPQRGNYLVIDHGDGLTTVYGQCLRVDAAAGDAVEAGDPVAEVGSTGRSTGPHLHFEVRQDGEAQNPVAYFDSDIRDTLRAA